MTRVEFFTNVPNKLEKATLLCEKAVAKGRQLTILTDGAETTANLQQQLWQSAPTQFLANAHASSAQAEFAPIVLDEGGGLLHQDDVLINLQSDVPVIFSRFRYLVEMVGLDEADKALARVRFKFYRDRGYEIKTTAHNTD